MKKSLKKALALLLCLVLCFSMLPLGAWATEEASEEADTPEETVSEDEVSEADIEPAKFEAEEDNIEETSETAVDEESIDGISAAESSETGSMEEIVDSLLEVIAFDVAGSDITTQISNTYSSALARAGRSSFNGYCGLFVNWELVILGINSSYIGADGNQEYDNYKNLSKSTGGYTITAYPASSYSLNSALSAIASSTPNPTNILVGFEKGSGDDGAKYGHTVFIHAIIDGNVYFSESFGLTIGGTYYSEGRPIVCSIAQFCSYYNSWTVLDGVIHFSTSTGYLSKCTAFPSYVKVKTTGTTTLKSLPCSNKTDSTSTDIATLGSGVTLTCTGLLLNDQGNYWYKVYSNDSAGMCYNTDCYVYAGNVTYTSKVSTSNYGAYVTGTNKPTTITVGNPYPVTGYIKSSYNNITSGGVQVYSGSNVTTGTAKTGLIKTGLNTKSFGLAGEVDNATVYNSLTAGAYTYVVSATLQGYYATSATEKTSYTISNVVLEKTNFSITSPSHTHSYSTTIVAPTCTEAGYTAHSCSCGYSYTDTATSPKGHTYAYSMTKEPTISATGTITRTCSNCSDSLAITMPSLNKTDYSYTVSGTTEKYIYTYLGNTFTVNKTLATYTISYNANGGSGAPASQTKIAGNALSLSSTVPIKAGNTFLGWATTSSATTPTYLAGSTYSTDKTVTLYAVWTTASCAIDTVWSDWSTTNPTNVAEGLKESKVQYRYRTRRETTSSEDTLDGWIKFDSVTLWSDYGEWTSWSGTAVTASDSREVESKVIYRYYCYICPTCGSRNAYNNSGCSHISNSNRGSWCETWSSIAYNQSTYTNLDSAKSYTTALGDGNKWYFSRGNVNNTTVGTVDSTSSAIVIKTGYRYRERTSEIVNSFYQYTAWSDWLDEALDVNKYPYQESRILYRYATQTVNEHNWKSSTVTTASSCITGGVKTYTCTLCGATKTEAIAALGHSYTTAVTAPTCTAQGYTKHTCSRCSDVFVDNYTSAIGHSITLQNLKNASCEEAGYTGDSVCTVCGTVTTFGATVSALGHSYGEGIVTKKATTTAQGEITYTCSRCSKTYIEYTPLLTEDDGNTATAQLVLNVSSITVQPGQDIEIPVTVNSNPGIAMLLFTVDYDETVLALTDCTSTALTDLFGNTATGKYCWVNGNNVTATGTIFTLHFKVNEAAASGTETAVRLVERMAANISETELTTAIVRGTVTVSNRTPGDVTGDGTVNGMDLLRLKKYLVGFDVEINTSNADVTGDGNVNGLDLLRLQKYLVGNDVTLQ